MLYERCHLCDGGKADPPAKSSDGLCVACLGRHFLPTGLDSGQLDRIVKAFRAYLRNSIGRDSAFESGHYYLHLGRHRLTGDDVELLVDQAVSMVLNGEVTT